MKPSHLTALIALPFVLFACATAVTSNSSGTPHCRNRSWIDSAVMNAEPVMRTTGASGDVTRAVGLFAAIAYVAWAVAFGRMLWGTTEVTHRFMGRLDSVRGYV